MITSLAAKNAIRSTAKADYGAVCRVGSAGRAKKAHHTHTQSIGSAFGIKKAKMKYGGGWRKHLSGNKIYPHSTCSKKNTQDIIDVSYSTMMAAAIAITAAMWGTTMVSYSEGAFQTPPNGSSNDKTSTSNTDMVIERARPGVKDLGIALAKLHERQKVTLGRILHDFHQLAKEAKEWSRSSMSGESPTFSEENIPTVGPCSTEAETSPLVADAVFIDVPRNSLENISPEEAWKMITKLRKGEMFARNDLKRIVCAAAETLKREPTVIDLRKRTDIETVTVVGDIHGDISTLFDILGIFGMHVFNGESKMQMKNKEIGSPWDGSGVIVFNGDFVDRGENSVGVILTLLLLKMAYPNNVFLNRGNHEDALLSTVYGFTEELQARYKTENIDDIWDAMGDMFSALPLCVRTDMAAIMHGGLPSEGFKLSELEAITPAQRYKIKSMLDPEDDAICQLVQKVLWSDPKYEHGIHPNEDRGAGVFFGPDITHKFLTDHGLKYLIRSHEVQDEGYHHMTCSEENAAITVFSSTNYPNGEGYNFGAVIHLSNDGSYVPRCFEGQDSNDETFQNEYHGRTISKLAELIAENKSKILSAFKEISGTGTLITNEQWADVMSCQLDLQGVDWLSLQPYLAPNVKQGTEAEHQDLIDYDKFLALQCSIISSGIDHVGDDTLETLRRNHEMLLTVFKFLDTNGDGSVDRDEFRHGMKLLSNRFPEEHKFGDPDALFDSIDTDRSGLIDLYEFEKAFKSVEVSYSEAVFKLFDKDRNGTIDREEFKEALIFLNCRLSKNQQFVIEESDNLFDKLDTDKSGGIDLSEIHSLLADIVPGQV